HRGGRRGAAGGADPGGIRHRGGASVAFAGGDQSRASEGAALLPISPRRRSAAAGPGRGRGAVAPDAGALRRREDAGVPRVVEPEEPAVLPSPRLRGHGRAALRRHGAVDDATRAARLSAYDRSAPMATMMQPAMASTKPSARSLNQRI